MTYALLYFTLATVTYFGVVWSMEQSHPNFLRVQAKRTSITAGDLVTFLFLVVSLMPNIAFMVVNLGPLFQVYASSDRLVELMDVPVTEQGTEVPFVHSKGQIDVMDVEFSYPMCEDV